MYSRDKEYSVVCSQCESSFSLLSENSDPIQFCVFCGTMLSDDDVESEDDDIE
jgi:rRNA maturation endonuclease Nob1